MINITLNQTDNNTKINTIKYIAQENGYDSQLIKTLIKNSKWKKCPQTTRKYVILSHHNKSTQKILRDFKKLSMVKMVSRESFCKVPPGAPLR